MKGSWVTPPPFMVRAEGGAGDTDPETLTITRSFSCGTRTTKTVLTPMSAFPAGARGQACRSLCGGEARGDEVSKPRSWAWAQRLRMRHIHPQDPRPAT